MKDGSFHNALSGLGALGMIGVALFANYGSQSARIGTWLFRGFCLCWGLYYLYAAIRFAVRRA